MRNAVLERLATERDSLNSQIDDVLAAIETDGRDPSEAERELLTRQRNRLTELEPMIVELVEGEERRAQSRDTRTVLERGRVSNPVATQQEQQQNQQSQSNGQILYRSFAEFARDELVARFAPIATRAGIPQELARERLTRAVANTLSSDVPGLLPPQHLAEIIDVINTFRPIVQTSRQVPLQNGTLSWPKITQRPTVAVQAAEKTETASTKMVVAMQSTLADTYLGAGDLSWQTINWGVPDALNLWFQLAAEAYAQQTEAAAGADLAAVATLTPVGADTFDGWYSAIVEAAGVVYGRVRTPATHVWADIATGFKLAGLTSVSSPVFNSAGQINAGTGQGSIAGLQLVPSPGLPVNTVVIGVGNLHLCAETPGAPVELRAVEPSIGGMEVGVIGAFASQLMDPAAFEKLTPPVGTTRGGTTPAEGTAAPTPASGK